VGWIGAAVEDSGLTLPGDPLVPVPGVELHVADWRVHVRGPGFDGEPAGQAVAGLEIKPEVVLDAGLIQDIDVGPLIDIPDITETLRAIGGSSRPLGDGDVGSRDELEWDVSIAGKDDRRT